MAINTTLTQNQVYQMVRNGGTGDSSVWNQTYNYLILHPNELFLIPSNARWSIGHQIIYHGRIDLFKSLLSLYDEKNPINIFSTTRDNLTILDVANQQKAYHKDQYKYIEHLFAQDKFIQACKTYQWATIDEMLNNFPTLLNEKPPYYSNYFIHYLVHYGDVRKFAQYNISDTPFQLDLKNADGKTALDLARETNNEKFIDELQSLLNERSRKTDVSRDNQNDRRTSIPTSPISNPQPPTPEVTTLTPQIKNNVTCMLTKKIFVDPVIASDGQTYERKAIIEHVRNNRLSPRTGEPINDTFIDNVQMKQLINELRQNKLL